MRRPSPGNKKKRALQLALGVCGVLALGAALTACFDPLQPACAFSCGPGDACPAAYVCASDGLCHREDGQGQCALTPPDGAAD